MLFSSPEGHHDLLRLSALSLIGVALATPLHDALIDLKLMVLTYRWFMAFGIRSIGEKGAGHRFVPAAAREHFEPSSSAFYSL
jgi:hypothetical protein